MVELSKDIYISIYIGGHKFRIKYYVYKHGWLKLYPQTLMQWA
jgi:hypothetical protein